MQVINDHVRNPIGDVVIRRADLACRSSRARPKSAVGTQATCLPHSACLQALQRGQVGADMLCGGGHERSFCFVELNFNDFSDAACPQTYGSANEEATKPVLAR